MKNICRSIGLHLGYNRCSLSDIHLVQIFRSFILFEIFEYFRKHVRSADPEHFLTLLSGKHRKNAGNIIAMVILKLTHQNLGSIITSYDLENFSLIIRLDRRNVTFR